MSKPCARCKRLTTKIKGRTGYFYFCSEADYVGCKKLESYKKRLESKRKYERGTTLINTPEKLEAVEFVWLFGKPMHKKVVASMQYRFVSDLLKRNQLYEAVLKEGLNGNSH